MKLQRLLWAIPTLNFTADPLYRTNVFGSEFVRFKEEKVLFMRNSPTIRGTVSGWIGIFFVILLHVVDKSENIKVKYVKFNFI